MAISADQRHTRSPSRPLSSSPRDNEPVAVQGALLGRRRAAAQLRRHRERQRLDRLGAEDLRRHQRQRQDGVRRVHLRPRARACSIATRWTSTPGPRWRRRVEQILVENVQANPDNAPCFTYQEETIGDNVFVIGVAITLTVQIAGQGPDHAGSSSRSRRRSSTCRPATSSTRGSSYSLQVRQPGAADAAGDGAAVARTRVMTIMPTQPTRRSWSGEDGIALVLAMFMVLIVSLLGASLATVGRTETMSSLNYKTMSQARYAAESGLHSAANYLIHTYDPPGVDAGDPFANYDMTASPVDVQRRAGGADDGCGRRLELPVGAKVDRVRGRRRTATLEMSTSQTTYSATATLLSMRQFPDAYSRRRRHHPDLADHRRRRRSTAPERRRCR